MDIFIYGRGQHVWAMLNTGQVLGYWQKKTENSKHTFFAKVTNLA